MPSRVDPNLPADGVAVRKSDLRTNFAVIQQELTHGGFFRPVANTAAERTVGEKIGETVSVRDFGAIGDGNSHPVTEWLQGGAYSRGYSDFAAIKADFQHVERPQDEIDWVASQQALNVGARVHFPRGRYVIHRPLAMRSFQNVFGDGRESVIYNPQTAREAVWQTAFILGIHHPVAWDPDSPMRFPEFELVSIPQGSREIAFADRGDADRFTAGEIVWLLSAQRERQHNVIPAYLQLDKIERLENGRAYLEDPLHEAVEGARIAKISGVDRASQLPFYACEGLILENLAVDARNVFGDRTCLYRSVVRNFWSIGATRSIAPVNAVVSSVFENVFGVFSDRLLEVKNGAMGSVFRNFDCAFAPQPGVTPKQPPVSTGEQAYDIGFERIRCRLGEDYSFNIPAVVLNQRKGYVRDSVFSRPSPEPKVEMLTIPSGRTAGFGPGEIVLDQIELVAGIGCRRFIRLGTASAPDERRAAPMRNVLRDIRLVGGAPETAGVWQDIRSNQLRSDDNNQLINIQNAVKALKLDWNGAPPLILDDHTLLEVPGDALRHAESGWNATIAFKRLGRRIWATELRRFLFAAGSAAEDEWLDATGNVVVRPGRSLVGSDRIWRPSPFGEGEYVLASGLHEGPVSLLLFGDDLELIPGRAGSLEPGQFAIGVTDGSDLATLHVRLPDDMNPAACAERCLRYRT
jgi:hypothetical protein